MDLSTYIKDSLIIKKQEILENLIFVLDGELIDVFKYNILYLSLKKNNLIKTIKINMLARMNFMDQNNQLMNKKIIFISKFQINFLNVRIDIIAST